MAGKSLKKKSLQFNCCSFRIKNTNNPESRYFKNLSANIRAERTFAAVLIGFHRHRGRTESRRHVATRQRRHLLRYTPGVAHTRNAARGESDEVLLSPESRRINLPLHHQSGRRHFQCPSAVRQRPSPWRMCRASRRTVQARRAAPA